MRVHLTLSNVVALAALSFLMQETHEIAHTGIGRLLCGDWGARDFNAWGLSDTCAVDYPLKVLPTFAGPIYTFGVIWLGYWLMTRTSAAQKSIGLALIVSSMPFSRVLTPLFGGGDEVFGMVRLGMDRMLAWPIAVVLVFALVIPPLIKIWTTIDSRRKILWIIGFLFVPFLLIGAVVFALLQEQLLRRGVLADEWIMGSPALVSAWFLFCLGVLLVFARSLRTLLVPREG